MTDDYRPHACQIIRRILEATEPLTPCAGCGLVIHDVAERAHTLGFDRGVAVQMAEHFDPAVRSSNLNRFPVLDDGTIGIPAPGQDPILWTIAGDMPTWLDYSESATVCSSTGGSS